MFVWAVALRDSGVKRVAVQIHSLLANEDTWEGLLTNTTYILAYVFKRAMRVPRTLFCEARYVLYKVKIRWHSLELTSGDSSLSALLAVRGSANKSSHPMSGFVFVEVIIRVIYTHITPTKLADRQNLKQLQIWLFL